MKTTLCIPKLRSSNNNNHSNTTQWLSPISLLERFREAVFRLIMLTALSKTTRRQNDSDNSTVPKSRSYYSPDQHQSDAVADCIEFIKKSSSPHDENRDSSARSSIESSDDQVALPALPMLECNR
ncbi:hypothetical protein AQUCO_00700064v1 [Aquilegia coerulea]|uniref:Uncharacterized protein n=1 Tax=Aquilegia coerulea TaxID=218851 RepID=A0A2G5EIU3_AQUCA|nr:hypothetical protein AQUCO_00700064v1 [Aquilegia coerulea]